MAIKDFDTSENTDRDNKTSAEPKPMGDNGKGLANANKGAGKTEIKNAHAAGDGSYGRSDESLTGEDAADDKEKIAY